MKTSTSSLGSTLISRMVKECRNQKVNFHHKPTTNYYRQPKTLSLSHFANMLGFLTYEQCSAFFRDRSMHDIVKRVKEYHAPALTMLQTAYGPRGHEVRDVLLAIHEESMTVKPSTFKRQEPSRPLTPKVESLMELSGIK
ncbi:hypothetical protein AB6D11_00860 [Vibrio splendidus]